MIKNERGYYPIILMIIFIYVALFILYAAKNEYVTIDKKKGIIKYTLFNIFLKKEETFQLDELDDIEILLKGIKRGNNDSTKYYIRFTFKNGKQLVFGKCVTFRKVSDKV